MNYIDDFIKYLKVIKKDSNYTLVSYKSDLLDLYDFYNDLCDIDSVIARDYLEYIYSKGFNRNTISRKLSAIRSFYNYLLKEDIVSVNYFNDISNPKRIKAIPKYAYSDDLVKIFDSFDRDDCFDIRNLLILVMLYVTGVRVSEVVGIKIGDIDKYNNSIKIFGKGSKERYVFFDSYCLEILDLYLSFGRCSILKDRDSDYLFVNKNGNKLSSRYVRMIIDDVVNKCCISYHISPHTFRHSFATNMLNNGADLVTVKELLGHSNLDTTSIYTHVSNEQIKKMYDFAHPRAKE